MSSKEIVKRTIHFQNPNRIAYNFDSNRTPEGTCYGDDFIWCFLDKPLDFNPLNKDGDKVDEWGCVWKTMGETFGEPVTFPLEGKEDFTDVTFPDYDNPERYQTISEIVKNNSEEKYIMGMLPTGIFQIMIHLFGFEDFMYQIAGNTENFTLLVGRLNELVIKTIDCMADSGVDGVILIEDMGLQDRMMISPTMWQEIYYPLYKSMFQAAHNRGLDVISHTCGHIISILDMYIDAGLDVIQMDQQDNMGLEVLSERYRGKVCFFCPLDIQTSLSMTEEEIKKQTLKMTTMLGTRQGGFMAKTYPQPEAIGIGDDYMKYMTDGFIEAGKILYQSE